MESDCKSESSGNTDHRDISEFTDDRIEQAIRNVVRKAFRTDEADLLTYRRIRTVSEKKLRLPNGSFKSDSKWAKKSKQVIDDALTREERSSTKNSEEELSSVDEGNVAVSQSISKRKRRYNSSDNQDKPFSNNKVKTSKGTKRQTRISTTPCQSSNENERETSMHTGRKHSKSAISHVGCEESGSISNSTAVITKSTKNGLDAKPDSEISVLNGDAILSGQEKKNIFTETGQTSKDSAELSESELSEVIDKAPPPTKRKKVKIQNTDRFSGKVTTNSKVKQNTRSGKSKVDDKLSPQEVEIKRLQSWLIKCGIRKVWSKELASHATARAKIQHLKDMLKDAGMEGRFSVEKANRIREQRELKADLEAVQEGAKMWGQTESEDSAEGRRHERGRRLARGLRNLDFLGSDDGEETD